MKQAEIEKEMPIRRKILEFVLSRCKEERDKKYLRLEVEDWEYFKRNGTRAIDIVDVVHSRGAIINDYINGSIEQMLTSAHYLMNGNDFFSAQAKLNDKELREYAGLPAPGKI